MSDDDNDVLLVGIAHNKVPFLPWMRGSSKGKKSMIYFNLYVSMWYAFEPTPPYGIVARSGYFCLPFPDDTDVGNDLGHAQLAHNLPLALNRIQHNCPYVSFVSGIVESVHEGKVVISYGINDCLAKTMELDKTEIASVLFSDPYAPHL